MDTLVTIHPLKMWRLRRGIKLGVLASELEITAKHLWRLERWGSDMSLPLARRIVKRTGLPLDEICLENPNAQSAD